MIELRNSACMITFIENLGENPLAFSQEGMKWRYDGPRFYV